MSNPTPEEYDEWEDRGMNRPAGPLLPWPIRFVVKFVGVIIALLALGVGLLVIEIWDSFSRLASRLT